MHLSDGILPGKIIAGCWAVTAMLAIYDVRRLAVEELPKVAVITSSFFVASLISIPLGPTSVHLLLLGLVGIVLKENAFLAILVGLVMQCFFFHFGGLTVIGVNALIMGLPALAAGFVFRRLFRYGPALAGGVAGGLAIFLAGIFLAGFLAASGSDFIGVAKVAVAAHVPVIVVESFITAWTVSFLVKVKPEILGLSQTVSSSSSSSSQTR